MTKYRIVKIGSQYNAYFIIQERFLIFFWVPFRNLLDMELTFNSPDEAKIFLERCITKPDEKVVFEI